MMMMLKIKCFKFVVIDVDDGRNLDLLGRRHNIAGEDPDVWLLF